MEALSIYVTAANEAEAKMIAQTVVEERLAACANLLGPIQSIYWWDGKMCEEGEFALLFKASSSRIKELIVRIKSLHSYDVPCITCHPIADGNPDFLGWISAETQK